MEADELSAVVIIKNGKKIVCGTQTGVLDIFSWGDITDCSDRMPGNAHSSLFLFLISLARTTC